ncbi:MAG: hypothetical protein KAS96_04445 [Planctomycetes bacterium]|nr:hypothetical protein [Planctomycetota bacterium]
MNNKIKYVINIAGTGVLVIVLLGIVFFWTDRFCDNAILDSVKFNDYRIVICPSGLITNEKQTIKEQGDKYFPSAVKAFMSYDMIWTLGMVGDFIEEETRFQGLSMMSVAYDIATDNISSTIKPEILENSNHHRTYFDKDKGLFVNCYLLRNFDGQDKWSKRINYYIGPEGIGDEPTEQLGRFIQPLTTKMKNTSKETTVFYDKGLSRFFRIKITREEKTVTKGSELDAEKYNPVETGYGYVGTTYIPVHTGFKSPEQVEEVNGTKKNVPVKLTTNASNKYLIVVNDNGRIDLLDTETLELKPAGSLPEYSKLQHGYLIRSAFFGDNYLGLIVLSISSDLRYMDTYVFDATGKKVDHKASELDEGKLPGGFATLWTGYIIESLQPAGFNILSYLTAHNYDGVKSQQAMFIRPNSFVASLAREAANDKDAPYLLKLLAALLIMGPSLIIGVLLGWRVSKRAKALGLSRRAVRVWTYGVIFTGVAGYLTFRFTKHAEMMVTCKNCGQLRRVEQDNCYGCKANWQMKHLKNVSWRILEA